MAAPTLAETLKRRREEHGLSPQELGVLANLSTAHVLSYESGVMVPYPRTLERLAAALDLPADELLALRRRTPRRPVS